MGERGAQWMMNDSVKYSKMCKYNFIIILEITYYFY